MDTTKCITNHQWEEYSQSKLANQELALLQTHVLSCEICADIKEGIDAMKSPSDLVQTVNIINKKIDQQLSPKKNKLIPLFYWSAAAAFIIVSGWLMLQLGKSPESSIAQQNLPIPEQELSSQKTVQDKTVVAPAIKEGKENASLKKSMAVQTPKTQAKAAKAQENISAIEIMPTIVDDVKEDNASIASEGMNTKVASEENKDLSSEKQVKKLIEESDVTAQSDVITLSKKNNETTKKQSKPTYPSNYSNNAASNVNFRGARADATSIYTFQNDSAILRSAQEQLKNLSLDSAQKTIEPLLVVGPLQEEALWILASVYRLKNNELEYKATLKKVIALNGKYKKEANDLLK